MSAIKIYDSRNGSRMKAAAYTQDSEQDSPRKG
jgi:hypothetical protein